MESYKIPLANWSILQTKLAKLNKRAAKLGTTPISLVQTGEDIETFERDGRKIVSRFILATLEGETPKIAGWTFVATLQRLSSDDGASAIILRCVPGQELPESYRDLEQACDHCQTARRRNDTFVVRNEAGEYKQVGSSCLADFLGHDDPHALATWAQLVGAFAHDCGCAEDEGWGGGRISNAYDLEWFLIRAAWVCRVTGWVSKKKAQESGEFLKPVVSTADIVDDLITTKHGTKEYFELTRVYGDAPNEADCQTATEAIDWVHNLETNQRISDYEHNLIALVKVGAVPANMQGIAASIVGSYLRAAEKIQQAAMKSNAFVGVPGERISLDLTCVLIRAYESDWGAGERVVFEDEAGNNLVWFTSSRPDFIDTDKGAVKLTFSIKKHENYQGRNQTLITRVVEFKVKTRKGKAALVSCAV